MALWWPLTLLYRRSGRPLPGLWKHLGLPSSGGLRGQEPERKRALSDPSSQTETQTGREGGDTRGGRYRFIQRVLWGASSRLFEETSGQVASVLPGDTCTLDKAPRPPAELGCSRGAGGGGARDEKSQGAGGAKGPARPQLWVGWPEPIWSLSPTHRHAPRRLMRELRTHCDPRQKCSLCTGDSP